MKTLDNTWHVRDKDKSDEDFGGFKKWIVVFPDVHSKDHSRGTDGIFLLIIQSYEQYVSCIIPNPV